MSYEFRMAFRNEYEEEVELFDSQDGTIRIAISDAYSRCAVYPSIEEAEQLLAGLYKAIELAKESKQ